MFMSMFTRRRPGTPAGPGAAPLAYTPPAFPSDPRPRGDVRKRLLVHVPGYDPEAKSRSRSLFVRELVRYAKRFALADRTVTPVEDRPQIPGLRWHVRTAKNDWAVDTTVEILRWDDIVARDFARPTALMIALMLLGMADYALFGVIVRFFRLNWKFACVIVYPFVMTLLLALVAIGGGYGAARLAWAFLPLPPIGRIPAWVAVAVGIAALAKPYYARLYVWHLLQDWVFNWQHGRGLRPDYEARVDRFGAYLAELARTSDADEIVVVGHSSGAVMAAEIVGRALLIDPALGRHGPELALLTLGGCMPAVAFGSAAKRCREDLSRLVRAESLLWVDYQAPQDVLNAAGFNPVRDLALPIPESERRNPLIRSARFRDIASDKTYEAMLRSPFRMHFQFLMGNDRPGEYDYVLTALGPTRLSERVRDPAAANSRGLGLVGMG